MKPQLMAILLTGLLFQVRAQESNSTTEEPSTTTSQPTTNATLGLDATEGEGTNPPYVYALISCGVVVLLLLKTALVILVTYRIHLKVTTTRKNKLRSPSSLESQRDSPRSPSPGYDDILSFSEVLSKRRSSDGKDSPDGDIVTACNEAYGVAPGISNGKLPQTPCKSKAEVTSAKAVESEADAVYATVDDDSSSLKSNDAYNNPLGIDGTNEIVATSNQAYGTTSDVSNVKGPQTTKAELKVTVSNKIAQPSNTVYATIEDDNSSLKSNDAYNDPEALGHWVGDPIRNSKGEIVEDGTPDYENLVSPDHLFGVYTQPEFDRPSSSAEVRKTFKDVDYSDLKGVPKMTLSKSLPDILEQLKEEDRKAKLSKKKSAGKYPEVHITLPTIKGSTTTLV